MDAATQPGPLVLVTNDDGLGAYGLVSAARAVQRAGWRPLVVAPSTDRSVTAMALGPEFGTAPMLAEPVDWSCHGLAGTPVYRMAGYPAGLVTMAAVGAFGPRPHLVLAGVNHGANTGVGVVHSGTVGAALTAALLGIGALAVSVQGSARDVDWARCEAFIAVLLGALEDGLPGGGALDVNLPGRPPAEPARIGWRPLSMFGTTTGSLDRRVDDDGHIHLRMRYQPNGDLPPANTDTGAVLRGDATLTWIPLPHGRPAPEEWRRCLLRRIRTGWSRCSVGRVSHPDGPAVTTPTR